MIKILTAVAAVTATAAAMPILGSNANHTVGTCYLGTLGGCNTVVARGIHNLVQQELNNMGYSFVSMDPNWVHCDDANDCLNSLQSVAAEALTNAARARNDYITLNSAWRTSPQQYLLYKWYLEGGCGIQIAAKPGQSNHESGLAVDTSYYDYWMGTLQNYGWQWYGWGDVVHFDYVAGGSDLRAAGLLAFQRVWNRYNSWKIDEDGIYGPDTANAFYNTPCDGW